MGTLTVSNPGIGYTPSSGSNTRTLDLVTISGNGSGAKADVSFTDGSATAATLTANTDGGSAYQVGDVLSVGGLEIGRDLKLTVAGIGSTNALILDNVLGEFTTNSAHHLFYVDSNVSIGLTEVNAANNGPGNVYPTSITSFNNDSDGLHIKVNHTNHGMYFSDNSVEIFGVESDVVPTKLNVEYSAGSSSAISVEDNSSFATFEGVPVEATNSGFLKIGNEIIEYNATSGSNLIGGTITRGANQASYPVGTLVYKYELSGVNLLRINKIHNMNDVTVTNPIDLDSYYVKLDMGEIFGTLIGDPSARPRNVERGSDNYPKLYIKDTKSAGGYQIRASQNIPYEIVTPMIHSQTVQGSTISASFRSTTSTGISGNEIPFINNGFEPITLNKPNFLSTPRAVFSKVNEDLRLTNVPGSKSMTLRLFLNSVDTRVSPVIDAQRMNVILSTNRINNPIENYITDSRVNTIDSDPSAFQYISRDFVLENSASSLKIILNAYINTFSDIRAFYCVENEPSSNPIFNPFPGYLNLKSNGNIIDLKNNSGLPDTLIQKTNNLDFNSSNLEYKEYTFTMDNLEPFRYYRIKLVLSSTNQVYVPRVKDLRVIALA